MGNAIKHSLAKCRHNRDVLRMREEALLYGDPDREIFAGSGVVPTDVNSKMNTSGRQHGGDSASSVSGVDSTKAGSSSSGSSTSPDHGSGAGGPPSSSTIPPYRTRDRQRENTRRCTEIVHNVDDAVLDDREDASTSKKKYNEGGRRPSQARRIDRADSRASVWDLAAAEDGVDVVHFESSGSPFSGEFTTGDPGDGERVEHSSHSSEYMENQLANSRRLQQRRQEAEATRAFDQILQNAAAEQRTRNSNNIMSSDESSDDSSSSSSDDSNSSDEEESETVPPPSRKSRKSSLRGSPPTDGANHLARNSNYGAAGVPPGADTRANTSVVEKRNSKALRKSRKQSVVSSSTAASSAWKSPLSDTMSCATTATSKTTSTCSSGASTALRGGGSKASTISSSREDGHSAFGAFPAAKRYHEPDEPFGFQGVFHDVAPSAMRAAILRYRDARRSDEFVSINDTWKGRSLLMQAILDNEVDVAKYLIVSSAAASPGVVFETFQLINHRDKMTGSTCLTLALESRHWDVSELILRHPHFTHLSGKTHGQDPVSLGSKNARFLRALERHPKLAAPDRSRVETFLGQLDQG
ncbi:unnamed protein product [Amoebophrya sp. A25]|nr:unnamed protein product [Amoebophrya sp. A25]|eukprot:GSA25T00022797001.1